MSNVLLYLPKYVNMVTTHHMLQVFSVTHKHCLLFCTVHVKSNRDEINVGPLNKEKCY